MPGIGALPKKEPRASHFSHYDLASFHDAQNVYEFDPPNFKLE
jgi:hypothetical protein